jgi:uncharacterized coiled-coil protein SlyX
MGNLFSQIKENLIRLFGYDPACPSKLTNSDLEKTILENSLDLLNIELESYRNTLELISQDANGKEKTIIELNAQINILQTKLDESAKALALLQTKLASVASSLYAKPLPAFLREVEEQQIILDGFMVKYNGGEKFASYPQHSAVFTPCPFYERVLTSANCNAHRTDLSDLEICERISNAIRPNIQYAYDESLWGRLDNWTLALITRVLLRDDCESLSVDTISAILYYQQKFGAFKDYSVFLGLGNYVAGTEKYGHAFIMLIHDTSLDLRDHYILEATVSSQHPPKPLENVKSIYYADWGLIGFPRAGHEVGTYRIQNGYEWWNKTAARVKPSLLERLKVKLRLAKSSKQKKHEHIKKTWGA